MPPTRRRPSPTPQPGRKPKVAGLRKPTVHPEHPAEVTQRIEVPPDIAETPPEQAEAPTEAVADAPEEETRSTPAPRPGSLAARRAARNGSPEEGAVDEAPLEPVELVVDEVPEQRRSRAGLSGRSLLLIGLAAATIVFGGCAAWFGVEAGNINGGVIAGNSTLSDSATTSQIVGQLTTAINTTFSYDYQNLDKTKSAVQNLLVGNAIKQYDQLFQTVEQQAPQQKLVLTTAVVDVGVTLLEGNRASALIFANQTDTRTSTNQTSQGGAMFLVNAQNENGQWKISSINTFDT
jgi:Mce-associated membrane protein